MTYPEPDFVREIMRRNFGEHVRCSFIERPREDGISPEDEGPWFSLPANAVAEESEKPSLTSLNAQMMNCRSCRLCESRTNVVFGTGTACPDLVVMGEAPGEREDIQGEPFVGKSGAMLDRMLERVIGVQREDVYILNAIKCRPPDNRTPRKQEVETCGMFLDKQLQILQPKIILAMGNTALMALFQEKGITAARGKWRTYECGRHTIRVMPTFHPAFLLRRQRYGNSEKLLVWQDLLEVKNALTGDT